MLERTMTEPVADIAADTMAGDLRDYFLERVKEWSEVPWQRRPAADQRALAQAIEATVRGAVRQAVELIAADGRQPVRGRLVKIAAKEVLQLQIDVIRSETGRHQLIDGIGSMVLVTVADASAYLGSRGPVQIDPDQPQLPVAA